MSYIKLLVVGNLGKDAVVKEINGKNVINFSVAHTDKFKDGQGNQKEKTTWVDCAYWSDKIGIAPYLTKGTLVLAEGEPSADAYVTKDNEAGASLRLKVFNVRLLSGGGGQKETSEETKEDKPESTPLIKKKLVGTAAVPKKQEEPVDESELPF